MRIKEVLQNKRMRQQDLAEKMGISLSAVKQMLNAESLTTATLSKMADALDVPIWQLFISPEEVSSNTSEPSPVANTIICPNCGAEVKVAVTNVELRAVDEKNSDQLG